MTDLTTIARENQFFDELVTRFFHPKSYFSYRIKKYLDNPLSFTDKPNFSISQITSSFIEYLNKSKQPAQELLEVSQISGLEDILIDLKTQLIRYDLRALDQRQLKKAIQNITLYFLKNFYQVLLKNEKSRNTLMNYLGMKMKLLDLLNNSNGKGKNILKPDDSNGAENSDASNEQSLKPQFESFALETQLEDLSQDSFNLLENDFDKEISQLLKPLAAFSNNGSESYANVDFVKQILENFAKIQELARYNGHEAVEAIAGRVAQLLKILLLEEDPISQTLIGLIDDAKAAIEKYVFHRQNLDNVKDFLDTVDRHIAELHKAVVPLENHTSERQPQLQPGDDEIKSFELNTSFYESSPQPVGKESKSSIFSGFHAEKNYDEDVDEIKIPGDEEDEDLLKLFHEINIAPESAMFEEPAVIHEGKEIKQSESSAMAVSEEVVLNDHPEQEVEFDTSILEDEAVPDADSQDILLDGKEAPQDHQSQDDEIDASINQIFQQEAALYFKILSSAISQLKNGEKIQAALEDLELASSSLKQLAQKFRMERLALLPELIETISIAANKDVIKIPEAILQGMEEGINLLKGFDVTNNDHKNSFMSILSLLKDFCSKTLSTVERVSII